MQKKTYTVHVRHGKQKKYEPSLVEAVSKDLGVNHSQFISWYNDL